MFIDEDKLKSNSIQGRTLNDIPCYRNSLLWGIGGGVAGGLIHFMFTSKVKKSSNVGMGTFIATTLGYWVLCRHKYSQAKAQLEVVQKALEAKIMHEGTPLEKEIEAGNKLDFKSA